MTLAMPDSTVPANLPAGYDAYAGYCDGRYQTEAELRARFPAAELVIFTVTGGSAAHGVRVSPGADSEPGDVNAVQAAGWVKSQLAIAPDSRPVVYADLASPGFSMGDCIAALLNLGITRVNYRVLTAHYTGQAHVCGPACGVGFQADGTQWTDRYPGLNGSLIDMSVLADDFFGPPPPWTFSPVRGLVGTTGPHSLRLTWSSPGQVAPEAVHHYQVTVRLAGNDIHGFPVDVPKTGVQESVQWNGVERGTYDEAMVRAVAVDGHASEWATVRFAT